MSFLTLFASAIGVVEAPDVSILSASSVMAYTATLRGQIDNVQGSEVNAIGFQWGTVSGNLTEEWSETVDSPYWANQYTHGISGLNEFQTYYFRFFATNDSGTTYSPELSLLTISSTHAIVIDSLDRTTDVLSQSLVIEDIINDQQNTCSFSLIDRSGNGIPDTDDEIIITDLDGNKAFAGYVTNVGMTKLENGVVLASVQCIDYSRLLDGYLVHDNFESQVDADIIKTIIDDYAGATGITYNNVLDGATLDKITFNYIQPSQVFRRIAELAGRYWYIDYDKDIHYFPLATTSTPFDITSATTTYRELNIIKDATQLKNRIYVRGGTKLSDFTTYSVVGDGVMTKFVLPDKPHNVTMTVGGGAETIGIKNIDTSGYDWYLNYQEKYLEQDAGGTVLETTDTIIVTYKYDIPILVAQEDTTSIATNGVKEFAIFDNTISTTDEARERASAELTDYANSLISGSFITNTAGFKSGEYINIDLDDYDIDDNYIVQKVVTKSQGAGKYEYTVSIASAKTLGIIRFLIDLLEANRNIVEVSDDEVVDELYNVADSTTIAESVTGVDLGATPYAWSNDAGNTANKMVWNLFEWS